MPLPEFNANGDLPPDVYPATMKEVTARFGGSTTTRRRCTRNLKHIYELAKATGELERFIVFGSYVTSKPAPNDVDVIMVMSDAFDPARVPGESRRVFDHSIAQSRFGASIFWLTTSITLGEPVDRFITHWQRKRDKTLRGIVEIVQ
jgi:hypothetical protein